jgi:predicted lactoylglutathione lyase
MISSIYLNLPIKNLERTVDFFSGLGFAFNPQFTSVDSTCMIIGENIFAMLCEEEKFQNFLNKPIADPSTTEVLLSLACGSAEEVREISQKAFELGGRKVNEAEDTDFMFSWGFEDLDGHVWDLFWINERSIGE